MHTSYRIAFVLLCTVLYCTVLLKIGSGDLSGPDDLDTIAPEDELLWTEFWSLADVRATLSARRIGDAGVGDYSTVHYSTLQYCTIESSTVHTIQYIAILYY